jgi:hypothetical protein
MNSEDNATVKEKNEMLVAIDENSKVQNKNISDDEFDNSKNKKTENSMFSDESTTSEDSGTMFSTEKEEEGKKQGEKKNPVNKEVKRKSSTSSTNSSSIFSNKKSETSQPKIIPEEKPKLKEHDNYNNNTKITENESNKKVVPKVTVKSDSDDSDSSDVFDSSSEFKQKAKGVTNENEKKAETHMKYVSDDESSQDTQREAIKDLNKLND